MTVLPYEYRQNVMVDICANGIFHDYIYSMIYSTITETTSYTLLSCISKVLLTLLVDARTGKHALYISLVEPIY